MITADLHTHTAYSHGDNSVLEMFLAGKARGLTIQGFSEHSPRPPGYDYAREYRDRLNAGFGSYVREVRALQQPGAEDVLAGAGPQIGPEVLFGLEMDWIEDEPEFMKATASSHDFDYIIGGIHFLGAWGFDADAAEWAGRPPEEVEGLYVRYYRTMKRMAESGLTDIVAHPDLIKIFTRDAFHAWLHKPGALDAVAESLAAVRDAGMAIEISSAGLRKPCAEIYPCADILRLAADLKVPASFGSDAHCVNTVAFGFDKLAAHARAAGYAESVVFRRKSGKRTIETLPIPRV